MITVSSVTNKVILSLKLRTKIDGGRCLPLTDSAFPVCRNPEKMGQLLDAEKRCESLKEQQKHLIVLLSQEIPVMIMVSDHN